jgi:hypothetical protein
MSGYTRRYVMTRAFPDLALTTLLAACGRSAQASIVVSQGSPSMVATRSTEAVVRSSATVMSPPGTPSPARTATITVLRPEQCAGPVAERIVYSFADKVRKVAELVLLGTVGDILPARWTTSDGQRPGAPKSGNAFIFTPVRVAIERLAKGAYTLPEIYFAVPGGRVGQDCESYTGSGAWPEFWTGGRFFYFVNRERYDNLQPVPGDSRYSYFRAANSYSVTPNDLVTIGPEYDIMGNRVDDPPRTLTVDQTLAEIAALLAAPATPTR